MAERLTEKTIEMQEQHYQAYHNGKCLWGGLIDKLGMLEDIMAKYDIESVEELDFRLAFKQNDVFNYKKITKLETDRDTWKKACELACDVILRFTDGCPCKADYFYQQAKKEGNDE